MRQDRTAVVRPVDRPGQGIRDGGEAVVDPPAVDESVIEQLASITDGQGFSVLGELLNAFLSGVPGRLETLDLAADAGDMVAVADQAHALTGSSASFGARGMADLCREMRVAAQSGDEEETRRLVSALHGEFLRVRAWLVAFRSRT